jgi:ASC-1-like (ASCH) protein
VDHVAYMKKSWGLLPKILAGEKQIESRWYQMRHRPWGKIEAGDMVFFKNSGEPVTVSSGVKRVLCFDNLTPDKVRKVLDKYGKLDGIEQEHFEYFYELFKNKKYCLLIFLQNVKKVIPFEINKKGFGAMAAWITVDDIDIIAQPAGAGR